MRPAILGVKDVFFLDFEDGELTASREFLGEVVRHIRQVKPYAVFTHDYEAVIVNDSFVNHADHRVTGLTLSTPSTRRRATASTSRSTSPRASSRTR